MNGSFPAQPDPRAGLSIGLGPAVSRHLPVASPAAESPAHPPRPFHASASGAVAMPLEPPAIEQPAEAFPPEAAAPAPVAELVEEELPWLHDWEDDSEVRAEESPDQSDAVDEDFDLLSAEAPWTVALEPAREPKREPEPLYEPWIASPEPEPAPSLPDWELAEEPEEVRDIAAFAWEEDEVTVPSPPRDEAPAEEDPAEARAPSRKPVLLDEVASRLEQIARTLRERRPAEIFSEDPADPLEILIAGYALGYTEATRHARHAQDRGSAQP